MRILITTGLTMGDVGGPAKYSYKLKEEFEKMGHEVWLAQYSSIESAFLGVLPKIWWAECVITLDTFSVGVPSVLIAKLFMKKVIVRIGGDFLWESYIERTSEKLTLKQFNANIPRLSIKENLIFTFTKLALKSADKLAFNTEWQKEIWQKTYNFDPIKSHIVRNYIP